MWRILAVLAVWWPSRLSGLLDGAPLDTPLEALSLGLLVPLLAWLHPAFVQRAMPRAIVLAILILKIGGALAVQQQGWCLAFAPPTPMVRDSTGKPHAWDLRADWLAADPACSALMTRSYRDTRELPAWFYNLPPPDDAPHRGGYGAGEIAVRETLSGFLDVRGAGTLTLTTGPATAAALLVDGRIVEPHEPGRHQVALPRGTHLVQLDAVLLGKHWPIVPTWNGAEMGSMAFPLATVRAPSRIDRLAHPWLNVLLAVLCAALVAWWSAAFLERLGDPALLTWSAASAAAVATVAVRLPLQAPWFTAAVIALAPLILCRARHRNTRGACMMVVVPWLAYAAAASLDQVGRWTLYGVGNDNFQFQRFAYRIFLQQYWLEGGQVTFWNQPLIRWIVGAQHMLFGDSSVGQVYWDAIGVAVMALFACRVVLSLFGFAAGVFAAALVLAMVLLGPTLEYVGFGLSEISSAACIYAAAFFAMRQRGRGDAVAAGVFLVLAFYTRLNNLPMALAVAAFAVPVATPTATLWRPRALWPLVQWRIVAATLASLAIGAVLFAWRTWYYTGVFSMFHGTQRDHLAVWKDGMTAADAVPAMISSVMLVLTASDPPALGWHSMPLVIAAVIAVLAVANAPGFRRAPLPAVALFVAGCSSALVTRGWAYEGRFSIHLFGAAAALCGWAAAVAAAEVRRGRFGMLGRTSPARRPS
jgi:hypothetical protein